VSNEVSGVGGSQGIAHHVSTLWPDERWKNNTEIRRFEDGCQGAAPWGSMTVSKPTLKSGDLKTGVNVQRLGARRTLVKQR